MRHTRKGVQATFYRLVLVGLMTLLVIGVFGVPDAAAQEEDAAESSDSIVFQTASGGDIYIVNANGNNLRYLTTGMDPALSPDGQWVAFTRWEDSQGGALGSLWVINVDGSGERHVLGGIHQPKSPVWSSDGSQIIISMQHGGRPQPDRKCSGERPPRGAYDIEINMDARDDIEFCFTLPAHPQWGLRTVNVDTGEFQDLASDLFSYSPTLDPANDWRLVYDGERGLVNMDLNLDTTWALTDDAYDHSPVFSPDGSKIALNYWQSDHWEIHVLNSDGTGRVRLTDTPAQATIDQILENNAPPISWNNTSPAWSPDGSQIAFLSDRTGQWEIWVMNADGSDQRPLLSAEDQAKVGFEYNDMYERVLSWN